MDAAQTMINNLKKNTGKSLQEWIDIVKHQQFAKHGEIIKFLKDEHNFTHGFANLVAHKAREADANSANNPLDLVEAQYKGKENLKPIYQNIVSFLKTLGNDIEFAPKNAYVSVRTKKQFALLQPATKTRFDIGLILRNQPAVGILEAEKPNAMCTHKIKITETSAINNEVKNWLKQAYQNSK